MKNIILLWNEELIKNLSTLPEYDKYLINTIVIINSMTIDDLKTSWQIFNVFSKYVSMFYSNANKNQMHENQNQLLKK